MENRINICPVTGMYCPHYSKDIYIGNLIWKWGCTKQAKEIESVTECPLGYEVIY